ncbi:MULTISPECIES: hypothetical protein [unclassified Paenibacillus]|uniref:hypothetical protein n=1 Tax=unclassified Paenibacillus TaxID=185978 RepID=UPI0007103D18|nr:MULTISPECIES: hypothetical protein [unclassified Paenibacillus]KQX52003.1 hypothetical protein ASD40_08045 [Paenibacillus sp. Root444D2]KRE50974.1 hypothetical protein ASG85_18585 [Paenibacillus sp. Soil724D2]
MAKLTVFYDFHEERIQPFLMALRFRPNELDWNKTSMYVPLGAPFQQLKMEEIPDLEAGITVLLDDLVINPGHPQCIGVSLSRIKLRHITLLNDLQYIQQLWIRMSDIEEVLQMDTRSLYPWSSN